MLETRPTDTAARGNARGQAGLTLMEILIALVVIGLGVGLFVKMHGMTNHRSTGNSKMMLAGQLIERDVEAIRIRIAQDTIANWPPQDTGFTHKKMRFERKVHPALSPKSGLELPNARKISLAVSWGDSHLDSLRVSTYVTRRF